MKLFVCCLLGLLLSGIPAGAKKASSLCGNLHEGHGKRDFCILV